MELVHIVALYVVCILMLVIAAKLLGGVPVGGIIGKPIEEIFVEPEVEPVPSSVPLPSADPQPQVPAS